MRRNAVYWIGLAVALLVAGLLLGRGGTDGPPLDPRSTQALGTRALVEFVESFGATTTVAAPSPDADLEDTIVLVIRDTLDSDERTDLEDWVGLGGRVVVIDLSSPLVPFTNGFVTTERLGRGRSCSIDRLDDVGDIAGQDFGLFGAGDRVCFAGEDGAYVAERQIGRGSITSLGGAAPLTNRYLDEADNAVLAARLLDPRPGRSITIVYDAAVPVGDQTLVDLIPSSVRWFGVQLLVAFLLFVLWRGRRFGAVVEEPQLVELPGSLNVRASGELRRRAGAHAEASLRLRQDLERRLRRHHRIAVEADIDQLMDELVSHHGADASLLQQALVGPPATNAGDLATLVRAIDAVSRSTIDDPSTPNVPTPHPPTADHGRGTP